MEQADLLRDFRIHTLPAAAQSNDWDGKGVSSALATVIVMTQSCDIAEGKVENIVLCPVFTHDEAIKYDPKLNWGNVVKKRMYRYHPLQRCDAPGHEFPDSMIDFGLILSVPIGQVLTVAARGQRITLCSPFREEMSNRFGQLFSRVALPD